MIAGTAFDSIVPGDTPLLEVAQGILTDVAVQVLRRAIVAKAEAVTFALVDPCLARFGGKSGTPSTEPAAPFPFLGSPSGPPLPK